MNEINNLFKEIVNFVASADASKVKINVNRQIFSSEEYIDVLNVDVSGEISQESKEFLQKLQDLLNTPETNRGYLHSLEKAFFAAELFKNYHTTVVEEFGLNYYIVKDCTNRIGISNMGAQIIWKAFANESGYADLPLSAIQRVTRDMDPVGKKFFEEDLANSWFSIYALNNDDVDEFND